MTRGWKDEPSSSNVKLTLQLPPDEALFDKALFDKALFDKALFDKAQSDEALFDKAQFDKALFDEALFDEALFDEALPIQWPLDAAPPLPDSSAPPLPDSSAPPLPDSSAAALPFGDAAALPDSGAAPLPRADANATWDHNLSILHAFVAEFSCIPTQTYGVYRGVNLGGWVRWQRQSKKNASRSMTPGRIAALEGVPGWHWEAVDQDEHWRGCLELLHAYVGEFNSLPPTKGIRRYYRGVNLGDWVHNQRAAKKSGGWRKITPERIAALERVPGWYWVNDAAAGWKGRFEQLCAYVEAHGRIPSRGESHRQNAALGRWVYEQRMAWNGTGRYRITPERAEALESVPGWHW
jgi:hypothetical protein